MRRSFPFLLAAMPFTGFAQPAQNFTCATAFEVPVSSTNVSEFTYVNARIFPNVVPDPTTTCSGTGVLRTGWYRFTATATRHWVRSEGQDVDGRTIEVLGGGCGSLTSLLCMTGGTLFQPLNGLIVGAEYHIRLMTYGPLGCDPLNNGCDMGLAVVSDPPNDECATAALLNVRSAQPVTRPTTEIATIGATASQPACSGGAGASDDDVWFKFTATGAAHHFPTNLLHANDVMVQWFSGTCGSLTSIACDEPRATGLTPGQEYRIRVHSESTTSGATSRLVGDVCESATNDECSGAIPIVVAFSGEEPEAVEVSTRIGTSSVVPCGTTTSDVWLSFTAPTTSVTVYGSESQSAALFSGPCGALVCEVNGNLNGPWVVDDLTPGSAYFLKVGANNAPKESFIRMMAAPGNDECTVATSLDVQPYQGSDGFVPGHTGGAATGAPACTNAQPRDVWYSFTATTSRHYVHVEPTVANEQVFSQVLSGPCGALTSVICDEDFAFMAPLLVEGLVPGTSYFVRVYTNASSAIAFRIGITEGVVNDECEGALPLPMLSAHEIAQQTETSTSDAVAGTSTCGQNLKDLWYSFVAADDQATFVAAYQQNGTSAYAELFSGTCGNLTSVACVNNTRARFTGLTAGTTYLVRYASSATNEFVPFIAQVPNDGITGAIEVPFGSSSTGPLQNGSGYGATYSHASFCSQGDADDDTWYRFTATASGHTVHARNRNMLFADPPLFLSPYIEVYDTLSTVADTLEAHMVSCGVTPRVLTGLEIGREYFYRVYSTGSAPTELCMFGTWVQDQSNDEAAGAVELTYADDYTHYFTTSGATQSMPGADCSTDDTADDDIWFRFTASNAPARIVVSNATADMSLELFTGTSGNLTSIACSDNVLVLPTLTSGQVHYVRAYSWLNATPVEGRIGLFITPSLTANSCVDETCLGPVLLSNPSIEQGQYCQPGFVTAQDTEGLGIPLAPGWPRTHQASSDSYSSCASLVQPSEVPSQYAGITVSRVLARSGKGMAGSLAYVPQMGYREYIQSELTEPLVPGEPYLVSFNTVLAPVGGIKVNGLGALLTVGPMVSTNYGQFVAEPQVISLDIVEKGDWTNICAVVIPDAAWDHITIGCFFSDREQYTYVGNTAGEAYHFFDDVVVARVTDPGCITSIGDVPLDEASSEGGDALRVFPNPASDLVNIVGDAGLFGKRAVIEVFDATGSRVHAEQVASFGALQPLDLRMEWTGGLYLVMVRVDGLAQRSARVIIKR